jgi:hypothetical protein
MSEKLTRREFLKTASIALALIPIVTYSCLSKAAINSKLRTELKYQDMPKEGYSCTACLEFIAGKTEKDFGKCKIIPADDEISPNGYCTKFNTM